MFKLAIDPGYGYLKAINQLGRTLKFPSLVAPAHDRSMERAINAGGGLNLIEDIEVEYDDGKDRGRFFVGDVARESRNATYAFDRNKTNHLNTRILIAATTALLEDENKPLWVGVGLPFGYFLSQGKELKEFLSKFSAYVRFVRSGMERTIRFDRVNVYPQGAASVYDVLLRTDGAYRYPQMMRKGNLIALVNWGTRTADVVVFKMGNGFKLQNDLSFTLDDAGAMEMRRMVVRAFGERVGAPLSMVDAENIILGNGSIFYGGKEYDLQDVIEESKRDITRRVLDSLQNRWGERTNFIQKIFFAGGMASDVSKLLTDHTLSGQIEVVSDPQMSEAKGMLNLMNIQERQERSAV